MACERNFIKPKTKGTEPRPREQILCQNFSVLEYMRTVALKLPSPSPPPPATHTHTRTRTHTPYYRLGATYCFHGHRRCLESFLASRETSFYQKSFGASRMLVWRIKYMVSALDQDFSSLIKLK